MPCRPERLLLAALLAIPFAAPPAFVQAQEPEAPVLQPLGEEPGDGAAGASEDPEGAAQAQGEAVTDAEAEAVTAPGVSEEVEESQPPAPNEQGMLQTETLDEDKGEAEQNASLYQLLTEVRSAPPGLDGEPIERPNPLASEPTTEMEPAQPRDAYLFPEGYIE